MIQRLAIITLWLLAGHAAWLGLFWGLLQVPESSIWMLGLSMLLVLALVVVAAALHAGALTAWDQRQPPWRALTSGVRHVLACLLASACFAVIWWATSEALEWHSRVSGQIDAAYIARTGRSSTGWIHSSFVWLVTFVRWSLGLSLTVSLLGALIAGGLRTLKDTSWVKAAFAPRRWLVLTVWLVLLVALPWSYVGWRPARLSLGAEPWFVGAKLLLVATAMAAGWALVLRVGHRDTENM